MSSLGNLALELALLFAGIAAFTALWGQRIGSTTLTTLSRRAIYTSAALVTLAVGVLLGLIFANDFMVRMVQSSSSRSLDWYFKITLLWVDLESSMLFWAWILALVSALAMRLHHRRLPELTPVAGAVLMVCLGFFLYLLLFQKNPFDEYLLEAPLVGNGMRPMLRNPWMLFHPPTQYLGYIATTVPFAFAVAALLRPHRRDLDQDDWLKEMRSWILSGWLFLGIGLVLGMGWAYELIDWGGWWGWDPIENASLFPWLVSTALLHASLTTLRRGGLMRGWTLLLVMLTFWLTILGTFMTRSGIVRSVHSFGEDKGLFWAFVIFMGIGMACFGLLIARFVEGRFQGRRIAGFFSLDFLMVVVLWLFLLSALVVLAGTLYPTIHEAIYDKRVTVGPPFFQRFMAPLGLAILALMSIAPLMSWGPIKPRRFLDQLFWPFVIMVVVIFALPVAFPKIFTSGKDVQLFGQTLRAPGVNLSQLAIGLVALTFAVVGQQLLRLSLARARAQGERLLSAMGHVFVKNRYRYAAYLVHVGTALMFLGFAGKPMALNGDRVMDPGDTWRIGGVELQYSNLAFRQGAEAEAVQAVILLRAPGEAEAEALLPYTKVFHESPGMPVNEPAILRRFGRDLHIRLADQRGTRVTLKVAVHPLVSWLWLGFLVMVAGALFGLLPKGWGRRRQAPAEAEGPPKRLLFIAGGIAGAWVLLLGVYLIKRTAPGELGAALALWAMGTGAVAIGAAIIWTFVPLLREDSALAPASVPSGFAGMRERLLADLRQFEDDREVGKLDAEDARRLARPARWELARILATEDAEAERKALEKEVREARKGKKNPGQAKNAAVEKTPDAAPEKAPKEDA